MTHDRKSIELELHRFFTRLNPKDENLARSLALNLSFTAGFKGRFERAKPFAGSTKSSKQLGGIQEKVKRLKSAIEQLSSDASLALLNAGYNHDLDEPLDDLTELCDRAREILAKDNLPARKGARPKQFPLTVARDLARAYSRLTGRNPTMPYRLNTNPDPTSPRNEPYGDFFTLIKDVFQLFDIKESPEHFAAKIAKEKSGAKKST